MSTIPYPWKDFSKKFRNKIEQPRHVGFFLAREAEEKNLRLVTGKVGSFESGAYICLYWLIDESDGIVCDARFQAYGPPVIIGLCEVVSILAIHKNYDQVSRISADLIDKKVRDKKDTSAIPLDYAGHVNLVLSAIDEGVCQCLDIPFAREYEATPFSIDDIPEGFIENFTQMEKEKQLHCIREVIEKEVQPFVALDAGGVNVVDIHKTELFIKYEGSCTSCHASTGSTLSAIEGILQKRIHPAITVTPLLTDT